MLKYKLFQGDESPVISIEHEMAKLSLESEFTANVIDTFRNLIPSLTFKIKEYVKSFDSVSTLFVSESSRAVECEKIFKSEYEKVQHLNYSIYKKTLVSTPEGFKGSFLEYLTVLNKIIPEFFNSSNELLSEYNLILSSFITNKDNKISLKDHTTLYKNGTKLRESVISDLDQFFVNNDSSKKYLGDVLYRFSDLDDLIAQMKKLEQFYKKQSLGNIKEQIRKSTDLLEIIIKNTTEDNASAVSGAAAKNIAEGAYEIGKLVETISIMHFKMDQTLNSVRNLFDTIKKIS
jgi:hypothetical protein